MLVKGRAATVAMRQTDLNMSFAGVRATIDPGSKRFDCSQSTRFPILRRENDILTTRPLMASLNPIM